MTKYWWANQSDNFEEVTGTLWTNYVNEAGARRPGSAALGNTSRGDIVFHCDKQYLRTVSVVVSEPVAMYRPSGYQSRRSGSEMDEGWLVLVEPRVTDLRIDRRTELQSIDLGGTGPLNKIGGLKRGVYLSPVSESSAEKLLELIGVGLSEVRKTDFDEFAEPFTGADLTETDKLVLIRRRVEQRYLRSVLLEESDGRCSMCNRDVSESLLVAGHIKPRWACSAEERKSFASIAMLICLLGCDSLYERGHIAVGANGHIVRSSRSVAPGVDPLLDALAGTECLQHNDSTAPFFEWHLKNTFVG